VGIRPPQNVEGRAATARVAEHGAIEVTLRPRLRVAEIIATVRRLRRFREQLGG